MTEPTTAVGRAYLANEGHDPSTEPTLNITLNDETEPRVIDLGGGVIVTFDEDGNAAVKHPCPPGYYRTSHTVGIDFTGGTHRLISRRPLTIEPSLHCDTDSIFENARDLAARAALVSDTAE